MKPLLGIVGLAGEYEVGFGEAPGLLDCCANALEKAGMEVCNTKTVMKDLGSVKRAAAGLTGVQIDALVVCVCTWAEDHHLLDLLAYINKPVILWSFPAVETGSMCGAHQICSVLTELGIPYYPVYGVYHDNGVLNEISRIAAAVCLAQNLQKVRIGTVGGRIKGMTEIAFDEFEIKKRTGVRIVGIDENELATACLEADPLLAQKEWESIRARKFKITSSEEHLLESMRYYLGMKSLIKEYALEGIVVKCYPCYMGKICLGYSILSEEGIVCGCEGDVNNTVMMKILYELTGSPLHNTDILYPDTAENTLLYSHCGSGGFSLAASSEEINLAPVRLANSGVCTLFTSKPGVVTLANLVGRGGTMRMSVMTGEAVPTTMEFPGNPLKVRFEKDVLQINREIAQRGIGHHWMAGYGDVSYELELFCRINNIQYNKI